jgi:hypothetical protein
MVNEKISNNVHVPFANHQTHFFQGEKQEINLVQVISMAIIEQILSLIENGQENGLFYHVVSLHLSLPINGVVPRMFQLLVIMMLMVLVNET